MAANNAVCNYNTNQYWTSQSMYQNSYCRHRYSSFSIKISYKKGEIELKFPNDTIDFLGNEMPLNTNSSGLYHLSLTQAKQFLKKVNSNNEHDLIVLRSTKNKSNEEIALKLHRSFAHPSIEKTLNLINNLGKGWSEHVNLKIEVKEITTNSEIFKRYKKAPPRPVMSLPMASRFQETVTMDLKFIKVRHFCIS